MISGACQGVPHSASQAESGPPVAEVDADNRMYTGLMDFEEDIRQHVLSNLPNKSKFNQDLAAKDASELLIIYGNWCNRLVKAQPRRVHESKVLRANPHASDPQYGPGLAQIIAKLQNGEDISPHLSRRICWGYETAGASGDTLLGRKDLDLMLSDWGVHHLHLSTEVETDGFVKGSKYLPFAVFQPNDAYLIDIKEHGAWTNTDLVRVIVDEWPDAGLVQEVMGIKGLVYSRSETERKMLRDAGIVTIIEIDGRFYLPTARMSSCGTPLRAVRTADRVFDDIDRFKAQLAEAPAFVSRSIADAGLVPPVDPDLHFQFFDSGYGVVERKTGFQFRLR
jgi:hypothetical protein